MTRLIHLLLLASFTAIAQPGVNVGTVGTFSNLLSRVPSAGQTVHVLGDTNAVDGGGGWWIWDATSTAAAATNVIVKPGYATGRWVALTNRAWFSDAFATSLDVQGIPQGPNMVASVDAIADLVSAPTNIGVINIPGIGSYRWDATNALSTNMLRIAKSGVATGRFVYADSPVRLSVFGVTGDGVTDDTAALQRALDTLAGQEVFAGAATYIVTAITVPANTTLRLDHEAELKWASIATNASVTMVTLNAGSSLLGGTLNGNRDVTAPMRDTSKRYLLVEYEGDDGLVDGVTFYGGLNYEAYASGYANLRLLNCKSVYAAQGPIFINCVAPVIKNWFSTGFRGNLPNIFQHVLDVAYCTGPVLDGIVIEDAYAASPAPSTVMSGISLFGNQNGVYNNILIQNQAAGGQNCIAMLFDGDDGAAANNIVIRHAGSSAGVEFQGNTRSVFNNFVIDGTEETNGRRASVGAHVYNAAINGLPSALYPDLGGNQARGGLEAAGNVFSNWRIIGPKTGFKVAASYNQFSNIKFIGCGDTADNTAAALRLLRFDARLITGWSGFPLQGYIEGNSFEGIDFINCATQLLITGHGDNTLFSGVRFFNGNQGDNAARGRAAIAFWPRISKGPSSWDSAETNSVTWTDLNITATTDYPQQLVHVNAGTGAGQSIPIQYITNSGNTVVLVSNWTVIPDSTSSFSISELKTGVFRLRDIDVEDDGSWSVTASMNLTNTAFTSSSRFRLALLDGPIHRVTAGLRLTLTNALGINTNLLVEVTAHDPSSSDIVVAKPISPTSGTFDTNVWMVPQAGTITGVSSGTPNELCTVTGTGTDFSTLPGQVWILANGHWAQHYKWNSATSAAFAPPPPTAFSNANWSVSIITAGKVAAQRYALDMTRYPVTGGTVVVEGLTHSGLTIGPLAETESSPTALTPILAVNSNQPNIGQFETWFTANTAATTITNLQGGLPGMVRRVIVGDTNTTLSFNTGSSLAGDTGTRLLQQGDVIEFIRRADGFWNNLAAGAYVRKTGDTMTGLLSLTNSTGDPLLSLQRSAGINADAYFNNFRLTLSTYNGWLLLEENDGDSRARFGVVHDVDGEEPTGLFFNSSANGNVLSYGGGSSLLNAATRHAFFAGATWTNTTGIEIFRIATNGVRLQPAGVGGDPLPEYALDVVTTTQAVRVFPRLSEAQRTALPAMGNGAKVYDTDHQRAYIYDTTTGPNWRGMAPFGPAKVVAVGGSVLNGTGDDQIVEATSTSDVTFTPYAGGRGWMTRVMRTAGNTNALIVSPGGTNTINGAASVSTTNLYSGFDIYHNGAEWRAIELNPPRKESALETAMRIVGGTTLYEPVVGGFFVGTSSHTLADAQARFVAIVVERPATLTGIRFFLRTTGNYTADNTNSVALYSYSSGTLNLVAQSANNAALFAGTANTYISEPFSAPYAAAPGLYYAALIYNQSAEVTAPVVQSLSVGNGNIIVPPGSTSKLNGFTSPLTGLPSSTTASGIASSSAVPILAVY